MFLKASFQLLKFSTNFFYKIWLINQLQFESSDTLSQLHHLFEASFIEIVKSHAECNIKLIYSPEIGTLFVSSLGSNGSLLS